MRDGRRSLSVSVVIPALNEERNLPHVLAALPADIAEVVLVDGGSVDRTVDIAREHRADIVVVRQTRSGKGNALACGFAACTGDIVVMIDADGSTDPTEIPRFVRALVDGADMAKGSRFAVGGDSHDITPLRRLGNHGLNRTVNVLFGTRFSDLCYGYNAFWRSTLRVLDLPAPDLPARPGGRKLWGDGFEIETLINVRAAAAGLRVEEVPSVELPRLHGESNLHAVRDGFRVLRTIVSEFARLRLRRRHAGAESATAAPALVPVATAGRRRGPLHLVAATPGPRRTARPVTHLRPVPQHLNRRATDRAPRTAQAPQSRADALR